MNKQINQLAGLLEDMMYDFGTYNMNGKCCENISHGEYRALRVVSVWTGVPCRTSQKA